MVATWKKDHVKELAQGMSDSRVVGLVSISGVPSRQFQIMRKHLSNNIKIDITRNKLIMLALEKAKIGVLGDYLDGPMGVVMTNLDPFELERLLSKSKTKSPAKPGSISPIDIVIPKGDTPFAPGPIIGELQEAGIKAKIQGGKIVVTEDSHLVSMGQPIPEKIAKILGRFGIEPIEIGLKLNAAYEDGTVYTSDVLHIDDGETIGRLQKAHLDSLNVALSSGVYNSTTMPLLLQKAHSEARNLAFKADILTKETVEAAISKAGQQAKTLASLIPGVEGEKSSADGDRAPNVGEAKPEDEAPVKEEKATGEGAGKAAAENPPEKTG